MVWRGGKNSAVVGMFLTSSNVARKPVVTQNAPSQNELELDDAGVALIIAQRKKKFRVTL